MTRVLLLDTAFAASPIHDYLVRSGFEVWTIGNRPDDVLSRRDPDRYIQASYADVELVQAHVDRLDVIHVIPGCTDVSIETALQLRAPGTQLDRPEVYRLLADKTSFRKLCAELELPSPRRLTLESFPAAGCFIAKPTDSFSGRGISIFDGEDPDAPARALALARKESRTGEALIETYVEGQLYSYSTFLEGHRVVAGTFVREDGSVSPFAVDTSYVAIDFPADGRAMLDDVLGRLAQHLQLTDGLLHVQFIWDGRTPWLIELCRRCPGDLYPHLIELSTGLPHAAHYAAYLTKRQPQTWSPISRHVLRHTVTAAHGQFEGLFFDTAMPVLDLRPLAVAGREVPPINRIDRVALAFFEFDSAQALAEAHGKFLAKQVYRGQASI